MKLNKKTSLITLLIALIVGSTLFWSFNDDKRNFAISKNMNIYYTLFRELNMFYVDGIEPGDLVKKSIDEMLKSLDPYTTYIPESEMEDLKLMTTGEYAGIGAIISKHKKDIIIAEPYEGFPAYNAGLKAGDIFVEINGNKVSGKNTSDVSNLLKGQPNVPMEIKVKRLGSDKIITKKLVRKKIQLKSVPYYGMLDNSIGYIHLNQFTNKASGEVKLALKELKSKNAKALVLDLRGNPGGLLDQAVKIVNLFVNKGETIVSTKGKVSQWDKTYKASKEAFDANIPIVVLVNSGSASASEIVSGALQDLDRAVVLGTRTFGKGLVQTTRNLSYNSKLKVTTAKYYIPSGRCIQALDYTHRNKDGSVGKIADSLITKYYTKNKRPVFDGGGILPDIKVKPDLLSGLSINLIRNFMIFDFATYYASKHDKINEPNTFKISDNDFADFEEYLKKHEFKYTTATMKMLDSLQNVAKKEKYFEISTNEFKTLKNKLTPSLDRDLKRFKKEISELLAYEITKRYYNQKGGILYSLKNDKSLKRAIKLLHNKEEYQQIIAGKIGAHSIK